MCQLKNAGTSDVISVNPRPKRRTNGNVSVRLGPLRYLIVTPNFHHWHQRGPSQFLFLC